MPVVLRGAHTGARAAPTGEAEEAAPVGGHLQLVAGLPLVVLTEHQRSLSNLQLLTEGGELAHRVGDLDVVYLAVRVGLLEVTDDVVLLAVVTGYPVQHQGPRADRVLLL